MVEMKRNKKRKNKWYRNLNLDILLNLVKKLLEMKVLVMREQILDGIGVRIW